MLIGDARDDLLAAVGDAGEAVHQREGHRDQDRGAQARPGRAGHRRHRRRREGADQQLALQADVDDARPLRDQPRHGAEDQRRRQTQRRRRAMRSASSPQSGQLRQPPVRRRCGAASSAPATARTCSASAPENRMISPWMTSDHLARDRLELEVELGAALVERAEQQAGQNDADRVVAPHQRHRDAGEAVAGGKFSSSRCWTPRISFSAMQPASAPEMHMATTIMRRTWMPA